MRGVRNRARSLDGVRVLVGRARHQAGALSSALRKAGAQVIEIPFIEIRRPRSYQALDSALKNLHSYDWLILTSVNGVEAMWKRLDALSLRNASRRRKERELASVTKLALRDAALGARTKHIRVAAIGPATQKAIEQRGVKVDVVPKEYVAESVVRSLRGKVKGKRVLLVRAKLARDVIPRELRKAGARVDVVQAYETVVPQSSRGRLQAALRNPRRRPHVVTFTSSSTVKNFIHLLGPGQGQIARAIANLDGIRTASIGPVTSSTLREFGFRVDIAAKEFTIPGMVQAIVRAFARG